MFLTLDPQIFCLEEESVQHPFFECVVAKHCCCIYYISEILSIKVEGNLADVGKCWLRNKKNVVWTLLHTSAVLWSLWKLRNEICFQSVGWRVWKCFSTG